MKKNILLQLGLLIASTVIIGCGDKDKEAFLRAYTSPLRAVNSINNKYAVIAKNARNLNGRGLIYFGGDMPYYNNINSNWFSVNQPTMVAQSCPTDTDPATLHPELALQDAQALDLLALASCLTRVYFSGSYAGRQVMDSNWISGNTALATGYNGIAGGNALSLSDYYNRSNGVQNLPFGSFNSMFNTPYNYR